MTKTEILALVAKESRMWDGVFGFRAIDHEYVQLWISRDQPIARVLAPFLVELPSKTAYVWMPEHDGEVVPVLVEYRNHAIVTLRKWAEGAQK